MISYAELLFKLAYQYQNERANLLSEKAERLQALEKYRGSDGYTTDMRRVESEFFERLEGLKSTFLEESNVVLSGMTKSLSKRGMAAPTDEQLRILQALRMKNTLTRADLDSAAETLRDCPVGLSILDDMAQESGQPAKYHRLAAMSAETATGIISGLREQMKDFAESDRSRSGRLAERFLEKYGTVVTVPERRKFQTKNEFFSMFCGLDPEDAAEFERISGGNTHD